MTSDGLLERTDAVQALTATLAAPGGLAVVEGGAGLGKSALLRLAADRAAGLGMPTLSACGAALEMQHPWGLALQIADAALRTFAAEQRATRAALLPPIVAELFARRFDAAPSASSAARELQIAHGLTTLVGEVGADRTLAVLVDDAHWADDQSVRFLAYLARRVGDLPVVLVIATRPRERGVARALDALLAGAPRARRVVLAPLGPEAAVHVVTEELAGADAELAEACHEVTGGNPFYLRELVRDLARRPPGTISTQLVRKITPAAVARSVLLRVAALGPDASAVARAVALLGDRASLVAIAELACLPAQRAADAADSLVDAEVLTTSGPGAGLAVAHPLVRAVLEQDIPALERAGARLRAARLLHAAGAPVERVAAHLSEAAATGEPWVVEVLRRAALMAVAQGAPVAAARWLARALEEPPAAEHRHAVLRELALAEAAAGLPEADARLQTVAADTPDPREAAAIALARGRLLHALGRAGNAATCLREGLEVVGDDPELRSQLLAALLSVGVFHAGLRADAIATVDAAMGEAPAGDTPAERRLLATMALRLAQEAAPQTQTLALARRAWAGGRLLADSSAEQAWVPLCWAHQLADTPAEGRLVAEAAQEAARERGSPLEYATASYCRGAALTLQGCPVEAEAEMERALAAQEDGWAAALRQAHAAIAMARAERGDLAAAEAALAAAGPEGEMPALERVYCAEARGRVLAYRGRLPEALAALQDCGAGLAELQARATASAWRPRAAVIANHLGDRTLAEELLAAEQEMVEAIGAPGLQSRLLRARGLITGGEEGIALLHAAVDVLASVDHHAERAPALADLGAALRRANQRAAAREPLRAALALAVGNGATLLADRVRTELAATGARPRREQTSGLDALTPSERRVARMAGEGLTNREIAHALFVTPKAVEFHLRNVYLKLGIENRRGLAEALAAPAV